LISSLREKVNNERKVIEIKEPDKPKTGLAAGVKFSEDSPAKREEAKISPP